MMTRPRNIDCEGFKRRFAKFGEAPTVDRYVDLFTPDGTVQHPGMPRPLFGREIRDFISSVLSAMPDFGLRPFRWCSRGDIAFVEAQSSGSLGDRFASWPAIYCVQLSGCQVVRGRSFYDRADVFAQLERKGGYDSISPVDPATTPVLSEAPGGDIETEQDVCRRYAEAWEHRDARQIANFFGATGSGMAPGTGSLDPEAFMHRREELFDRGTLRQRCQEHAAGPGCAFFQWDLSGTTDGRPFSAVAAERISLNGSKIATSRLYFDTLAFEARRDSSVASRTIFDAVGGGRGAREQSKGGQR